MTTTQAPKAQQTRTGYHSCSCEQGCPARTQKTFAQGHDARMASRLASAVAGGELTADEAAKEIEAVGGGPALAAKMRKSAELRQGKRSKPAGATRQQAADTRIDEQRAQLTGKVHYVVHGKKTYKAVVVRNAAGDLVARHRLLGRDCDHTGE